MSESELPENVQIGWSELDEKNKGLDNIVQVLSQVNDVLKVKEKAIYFVIVPSFSDGIEIAWFERDD